RNAGGLFESVRRLVQSLHDTGMDVCVFGTADDYTQEDIGAWAPVTVQAFRPYWPASFGYSPHFMWALNEFAPDITHTHGIWVYSSVVTNQYSRVRKTPYVISAHGMLDPWAIRNSRWKKVIAHFFYEGAHLRDAGCLRALCESEARAIRQLGLKNPIAIIPNGIDLPEPGGRDASGAAPWAGWLQPGQKLMLFLSRIHPKKGLVNLIKAWELHRKSPAANGQAGEWVLGIAGWDQGGHEAELKRLATELGIPWADVRDPVRDGKTPALFFLGPQFNERKTACYRQCDAFVLPSFSEGVPMVVLEAWTHAKPVLMTPECNLPIGFARNAALRIETSPESIASGLREFLDLPDSDRAALGRQGLQLVQEQFVWPLIGQEMARLYEWMLGRGNKPACIVDF
ncbi:MAG TPA: glycosyltransferase, partial [Verrucomicrobiae bacterium]